MYNICIRKKNRIKFCSHRGADSWSHGGEKKSNVRLCVGSKCDGTSRVKKLLAPFISSSLGTGYQKHPV